MMDIEIEKEYGEDERFEKLLRDAPAFLTEKELYYLKRKDFSMIRNLV